MNHCIASFYPRCHDERHPSHFFSLRGRNTRTTLQLVETPASPPRWNIAQHVSRGNNQPPRSHIRAAQLFATARHDVYNPIHAARLRRKVLAHQGDLTEHINRTAGLHALRTAFPELTRHVLDSLEPTPA